MELTSSFDVMSNGTVVSHLQLGSAETYRILGQNGCITLDGVDDAEQFRGVQKAFDTVGMDAEMQMQVSIAVPLIDFLFPIGSDGKES